MNPQVITPTNLILNALGELGMQVQEGTTIAAAQNTPGIMNVVIPHLSIGSHSPLSDSILGSVAGGTQGGVPAPMMPVLGFAGHIAGLAAQQAEAYQTAVTGIAATFVGQVAAAAESVIQSQS